MVQLVPPELYFTPSIGDRTVWTLDPLRFLLDPAPMGQSLSRAIDIGASNAIRPSEPLSVTDERTAHLERPPPIPVADDAKGLSRLIDRGPTEALVAGQPQNLRADHRPFGLETIAQPRLALLEQ